ncbi:MAG: hypothetical protein PF508_11430 [Spirochaeta sp.]|jgi:hypothetical protein|nr:hypothetical protein [Spirochaeta sp.]
MKEQRPNRTGDGKRQRRGATKPDSTRSRSPTITTHPHDRLFKEVFSTQEAQQDLIGMAFPAEITSRFRIDTVRDAGQETGSGRADLVLSVYTEEEGRRMKSIADVLQEEGLVKGLEQGLEQGIERGKADVLVRLLHRRFGITPEEETVVRDCHDPDRLDAAAEVFADATASKEEILALLK